MATDLSRRKFLRGAAGLAAVATLGASGSAEAQQTPGNIRFGQHDIRGESEAAIITAAAHSSVNGVALIVRTQNQDVWRSSYRTAHALAEEGYPVSYVLAADGPDRLDIYAKGVAMGQIHNPGNGVSESQLQEDIRGEMIRSYNLAFAPPQVSATPTSG